MTATKKKTVTLDFKHLNEVLENMQPAIAKCKEKLEQLNPKEHPENMEEAKRVIEEILVPVLKPVEEEVVDALKQLAQFTKLPEPWDTLIRKGAVTSE